MNEMENSSSQVTTEAQSLGFYGKFIGGEFGLAKTYWLLGVVPSLFAGIAVRTVSSDALAYWIGAAFVTYQFVLLVALWNAGKKYQGSRVWSVLAFLMVLLAVLRNIGPVLAIGGH
jgi:hypothetical protein